MGHQLQRVKRLLRATGGAFAASLVVACYTVPVPDPELTALSHELAVPVAERLGVPPRKVDAAWLTRIETDGGNYVERDRDGRETRRILVVRRDVWPEALRATLVHELVHAHVADRGLSVFEEEGLCNLITFQIEPEWGRFQVPIWREHLKETGRDVAWAKTIRTSAELQALPDDDMTSFYALAYFDAAARARAKGRGEEG